MKKSLKLWLTLVYRWLTTIEPTRQSCKSQQILLKWDASFRWSLGLNSAWVEVKADGLGDSGRSKAPKVDGPKGHKVDSLRKWTVENTVQITFDGPSTFLPTLPLEEV